MGLGGYLTWTSAIREISKKYDKKIVPCEASDNKVVKIVRNEVFKNNPYVHHGEVKNSEDLIFLPMNLKETNYCLLDTPHKAFHRTDKHIIHGICEYYGIHGSELKCELYFDEYEREKAKKILKDLESTFIVIEPISKENYTPNRAYPFDKWQKIVNELSKKVQLVQVGKPGSRILKNVKNLTGATDFRTASALIENAACLLSSEGGLVHAANAVGTRSVVIITGYQDKRMVSYPENINIDIASHGPCGLKMPCDLCKKDASDHDCNEVVKAVNSLLENYNEK